MSSPGQKLVSSRPSSSAGRPPIVAVLGHVDHGKTTLLDAIRKTDVVNTEHGGITQHIGAYQAVVYSKTKTSSRAQRGTPSDLKGIPGQARDDKAKERLITFIDTPGHEAFAKMRERGANASDIAVLVVSASDSVKPQTIESIGQIKQANIPMIVVLNKIDLPTANIDKVKQDLAKVGVAVEGFGGDVPCVNLSAKQGTGIPELLDLILLVFDMHEHEDESKKELEAVVVETRVDKGKGMIATLIVKKGTLTSGKKLFEGSKCIAKVRAMFDENGVEVKDALPGKPVEVLGFTKFPQVGSLLTETQIETSHPVKSTAKLFAASLPDFLKPVDEQEKQTLNIVLNVDTAGSLEAITASLDPRVRVLASSIGDISEADILFAKGSGAVVVGFNVLCKSAAVKLAETEKVIYRMYTVIYELLEELSEVVAGLKDVATERELGMGNVIAEFPFEKQRVAGTKVASGRLARGDSVKILREGAELARAKIRSLQHGKESITKAESGTECGILFDKQVDFAIGDAIIAVTIG